MSMRYYISTEEASFFINNRMGYANSIPTSGNYKVGDFIISSTQEDGIFGWVCTVAGTPGEWEVIGSGMGNSGSGMHDKVVGYINAVSFSDTRSSIEIGINEYEKGKDFLEVHYNGLMLAEGVHYNVSSDGRSIEAIDGSWNENADDIQQMIFRVLKSEGIGLKELKNTIDIDNACYEVELGIEGYNPDKDVIEVHLNGVLLVQGLDYNVSDGKIIKVDTSEAWNPYNVNGQKMFVKVMRNKAALIEPSDGSVTIDKLSPDVAEDVRAIDGLVNSISLQNNTISNIDNRMGALEEELDDKIANIDLSNYATKEELNPYQEKKSDSLATNSKDIVGAINEVFQSGNNVKQNLVDALIAKGVQCSTSDSFSKLISLIYGLTYDDGSGDDTSNENLPSFEGENTWASCVSMKVNRYALSAAAVDKKIYTFGGYNTTYCNNVEVYDTELGTWETKKSMNKSLAYTCAEAVGTNIYVFGGSNKYEECDIGEDYYLIADTTLRVYDTLTDTWTTKGSIKALSYSEPAGLSSTVIGEDIYYAGGAGEYRFNFTICKYTPKTNTYTTIGDQYGGQANFVYTHSALCASNGKLYEMGGRTVESAAVSAPLGATVCSIYDPSDPSAEANDGPALPREMHSMGYATVNDKIYLIGGAYGVGNYYSSDNWETSITVLDKVYELNTYTNKWTEVSTMITPRYGAATAVVDNVIYIIGGANSKGLPLNTVEAYCPPGVTPPTFSSGASSVGLNIINATELPSEVVNNQIVLISNIDPTAVEIKDNSLCNPSVEGMVNVGTTSTNNGKYCTIAKDNITVLLYLIRALQYVNGSVKQLSAYVGIDGSWVQFSWAGLYAFISGAYENSNLFGTFTNAATSSTLYSAYPPEISGNNVKIGQTSSSSSYDESGYYKGNALYYFTTKINCTNYSKLKITVSNYSKTNVSTGYIHFGIKQANNTYFNSSTDKYIEITKTGTYEVDLSSYNSTGYIAAYIFSNSYSSTKNCSAYVYISSIELMP